MHLLLRADASAQIGTGHVMRCLALAQAWQEAGGQATFLMTAEAPALEARLIAEHCQVHHQLAEAGSAADGQQTIDLARQVGPDWLAVDGYQFGTDYQRTIKQAGLRVLFIDDYGHASPYSADLVLNQNISASETLYASREPYTQLLLGTRYVLLRREFWPWRGWQREIAPVARKVLVTLGGSDLENVTLKVVEALQEVEAEKLEATVLVGASNPHLAVLESKIQNSKLPIRLLFNAANMPEAMAEADIAIAAGGSTCWELAFLGVPTIVSILAVNQGGIAEGLHQIGMAINLGESRYQEVDGIANAISLVAHSMEERQRMSWVGQALVDGRGGQRVVQHILAEGILNDSVEPLAVRPANVHDAIFLWKLANDAKTRANSFTPAPISLAQHLEWYQMKLSSSATSIWIVEIRGEAIAQVRYDRINADTAEIDFSVAPAWRNRGIGTRALLLTRLPASQLLNVKRLVGVVQDSNPPSRHAFLNAGFKLIAEDRPIHEYPCSILEWQRKGEI